MIVWPFLWPTCFGLNNAVLCSGSVPWPFRCFYCSSPHHNVVSSISFRPLSFFQCCFFHLYMVPISSHCFVSVATGLDSDVRRPMHVWSFYDFILFLVTLFLCLSPVDDPLIRLLTQSCHFSSTSSSYVPPPTYWCGSLLV